MARNARPLTRAATRPARRAATLRPGDRAAAAGAPPQPCARYCANARTGVPGVKVPAMNLVKFLKCTVAAVLVALGASAQAQGSSYTPGTVWIFSNVQIEPGQFENYLDFLASTWKKSNEFGKKEGNVVSYHVFAVNNPRNGEPDLILAIESRDYMSNADQLALQKKYEEFVAMDQHKLDAAGGERKVMRKISGGMELQELKLK
jgi:hypothetical protein